MSTLLPEHAAYDSSVADRVARLNVMLKRQLATFAKDAFDLTIVETRLLLLLAMAGPTTVSELANRSDMDRTQISRSISLLTKRSIVAKSSGEIDRREAVIKLTRSGAAIHKKILAELYARNQMLISGLSEQALASFFDVMETLIVRARSAASGRAS